MMVLASFVLQLFLLLTGNLRRRSINGLLRLLIWLAYVGADLVAVYALGLFSQYEDKYKLGSQSYGDTLPFLWVPFLLVHLGGQDSITAFSIEDNNLWLRHLLNLGIQVALSLYVFWKSFPRIHLLVLVPALFVFVSGIIKYGERTWALNSGSRDGLGANSRVTTPSPSQSLRYRDMPFNVITSMPRAYTRIACSYALQTVLLARGLFVGRTVIQLGEWAKAKMEEDFRGIFPMPDQMKLGIVMELSMMFDLLYTKAMVLQRWWGVIFRGIAQVSMVAAFGLFAMHKKHANNMVNVIISYILFLGAIFMECWSLGIVLASPWTKALVQNSDSFLLKDNQHTEKRWMLNSLGQFNLMDCSIAWKSTPAVIEKVLRALSFDQKWRIFWHTNHVEAKSIIEHIVSLFHMTRDGDILKLFCKSPEFGRKLNYTLSLPFEHALYRLHIYTDLLISRHFAGGICFVKEDFADNIASHDDPHKVVMSLKDDCAKLSNYMIYLMLVYPSMLPVSTAAEDVGPELPNWVRNECGDETTKLRILEEYGKKLGREPGSASPFGPDEEQAGDDKTVLTLTELMESLTAIKDMWVRLLIYATGKCPGELHARQLGNGGELITFVWLLMLHHGFGDAAREIKLLISDDGSVPELGSLVSAENSSWVQKLEQPQYAFDFRRHQQHPPQAEEETTAGLWRRERQQLQPARRTSPLIVPEVLPQEETMLHAIHVDGDLVVAGQLRTTRAEAAPGDDARTTLSSEIEEYAEAVSPTRTW